MCAYSNTSSDTTMHANSQLIIACLIIMVLLYVFYWPPLTRIKVANREWAVVESYPNATDAANMLHRLHARMLTFLRYIEEKHHIDETQEEIATHSEEHKRITSFQDRQMIIGTLLNNYNPDKFYENDPRYSSDTSYTINKGDAMYICLRQKADPTKFENENVIFFVMLHECAHIANYNGWGHDERFWTVFKFLLQEAVEAGVYSPVDYEKYPEQYCSIEVFYQPLYDKTLAQI